MARYYLYEHGFSLRLILIESYSLFLFIFFYAGISFWIDLSIFFTSIIGIFLSTFFVQRGDWFNPIQFFVPITYILNIYTALFYYNLFKKSKLFFYLPKKNSSTQKIISKFNQKKFLKIFDNDEVIIYNRLYEGKISNNFGRL